MNLLASVWLYGSHARGDADSLSDIDLLVVCNAPLPTEDLAHLLPVSEGASFSVSRYSWAEFGMMAEQGSLFLEHVKSEGVVLFESSERQGAAQQTLNRLRSYVHARRDLEAFRTVLADVREELLQESPPSYELAVLGTVIRHASILGCYLLRRPCFGRTEPVRRFSEAVDFPASFVDEFAIMYRYRLALEGRPCQAGAGDYGQARQWLGWAECVVDRVGEICDERL